MIRLSVTDLETWRYWSANEDASLDDLLARLARVEPPNRKMAAGAALAKFFEHARVGEQDAVVVDGWRFNFDLEASIALPSVRELKLEKTYKTPSGLVTLVGKVDGLDGLTVHDQKLSDHLEIEERYTDSLQWPSYLDMVGARRFIYDVFIGRVPDDEDEVTITEYHPVTFYAYPGLHEKVHNAVCELAEVVARYQPQIEALKRRAA